MARALAGWREQRLRVPVRAGGLGYRLTLTGAVVFAACPSLVKGWVCVLFWDHPYPVVVEDVMRQFKQLDMQSVAVERVKELRGTVEQLIGDPYVGGAMWVAVIVLESRLLALSSRVFSIRRRLTPGRQCLMRRAVPRH